MTTTDDAAALTDIARALDPYLWEQRDKWADTGHPCHGLRDNVVAESLSNAARVLPIIRERERAARAEALRALSHELIDGKDPETDPRIFDPWDVAEMLDRRATHYPETEDQT